MAANEYAIETRLQNGEWSEEACGDVTRFATEAEAEATIAALRELGDEWADAEYRVREHPDISSAARALGSTSDIYVEAEDVAAAAATMGRKGGKVRSERKAVAVRENGRKGGRPRKLVLVRSDEGDGGWSLHAPGSTDEDIASGDAPPLLSGPSAWDEETGDWARPNTDDYAQARAKLVEQG